MTDTVNSEEMRAALVNRLTSDGFSHAEAREVADLSIHATLECMERFTEVARTASTPRIQFTVMTIAAQLAIGKLESGLELAAAVGVLVGEGK
jgi:hypothetical protein